MPFLRLFFIFFAFLAFSVCGGDERPPTLLQTRDLRITSIDGTHGETLVLELALTPAQRQQGLMHRQLMPEDAGMLFRFERQETGGFWMEQTFIPLTIAYLDEDGTVLELRDGKPLDRTILTPAQPYRNTLEVNQGWFERHQLGVGAKLTLPPDLPVAR